MPRSMRNGDYDLLLAFQSPRDSARWYRVLADRHAPTLTLSCDCPTWRFNQRGDRSCKHTTFTGDLLRQQPATGAVPRMAIDHPLIGATRTQWTPLREFIPEDGWGVQEAQARIGGDRYRLVLLEANASNGLTATGTVAFAESHPAVIGERAAAVAGWCGWAIAAAFARQAGLPLRGEPPAHYAGSPAAQRERAERGDGSMGVREVLQIGNRPDLGDGLTPAQRAENTLRLFLGQQTYALLERQLFLDIPSGLHPQRVYRLRRDPDRRRERRIRVFERGHYGNDFCVVRAQHVPEADHFLTLYFGLIANESWVLSVVGRGNIFSPNSDGPEREIVPAIWTPRTAMPLAA